ncbi:MAG: SDR family oxidoreductase, partial [Chitinophagaceae bacterium]|nr:SDR family oxidoreductase [Chitinophagaceae bacterium]
ILVTGGLGYVGGRIVKHLLANSNSEIVVSSRRKVDVAAFFRSSRVKFCPAQTLTDISHPLPEGVDAIIHLAATNEIQAAADPADSIEVNVRDSYMLLQKAVRQQVKRFLYFSTAHVYSSPLEGDITEELCPKPLHPYAITHKGFEDFLWAAHKKKEIEGIIIRLSNSFGAPIAADVNRWSLLVNDLCRQAVINRKMTLKSSGLQLRDFVTLTDVCRAVNHLLHLPVAKVYDGIFNLGGDHVISIFEMAKLVQRCFEEHSSLVVPLIRPEPDFQEKILPLSFHSKRLVKSGFVWKRNVEEELNYLIEFCIRHFS